MSAIVYFSIDSSSITRWYYCLFSSSLSSPSTTAYKTWERPPPLLRHIFVLSMFGSRLWLPSSPNWKKKKIIERTEHHITIDHSWINAEKWDIVYRGRGLRALLGAGDVLLARDRFVGLFDAIASGRGRGHPQVSHWLSSRFVQGMEVTCWLCVVMGFSCSVQDMLFVGHC